MKAYLPLRPENPHGRRSINCIPPSCDCNKLDMRKKSKARKRWVLIELRLFCYIWLLIEYLKSQRASSLHPPLPYLTPNLKCVTCPTNSTIGSIGLHSWNTIIIYFWLLFIKNHHRPTVQTNTFFNMAWFKCHKVLP